MTRPGCELLVLAALGVLSAALAFQPVGLGAARGGGGARATRWVRMSEASAAPVGGAAPGAPAAAAAAAPTPKRRKPKRDIKVLFVQETPGGFIGSVAVTNFKAETEHRIVVAKDMLEDFRQKLGGEEVEVDYLCKCVIKLMLDKGMKLDNTEGMIDASVFPVNYFTIKQLSYFHPDAMENLLEIVKAKPEL